MSRRLVLDALVGGTADTVGDLLDLLAVATPAERRELLDAARVKAGLESTEDIEFGQRFAAAQRNARAAAAVAPPPRFAYNDCGLVVNLAEQEQEAAREQAREESRRVLREEREAQRAQAAAERAEHVRVESAAMREASRDQFPWGLPA